MDPRDDQPTTLVRPIYASVMCQTGGLDCPPTQPGRARRARSLLVAPLLLVMAGVLGAEEVAPAPLPPPSEPVVLSGEEAKDRAGEAATVGKRTESIRLLEDQLKRDPDDTAALHALLAARVAQLEDEIHAILMREVAYRDLAAAPKIDYAAIKARSDEQIQRRLVIPEYFQARDRLGEAVEACDSILVDHVGHPAVLAKKLELLKILEVRARDSQDALLTERDVRDLEVINEVIEKTIMPREKQKIDRSIMLFDEDIADIEKSRVRQRLKERVSLENMVGVEVRKVIETLFAIAGINYVIVDSAISTETLSLNVIDESLENILSIISRQVDLRYNYIAGTVYISSSTSNVLETEIIRLQSGLTDVMAQPTIQTNQGSGGGGGQGAQQAQLDPFNLGGQQDQGGESKSDLERFLDKIPDIVVGWPAEGTIYLDRKSNSLFVRSTPATILEVKRLLQAIDYNSVQVLIEARFVLISESAGFQLGIDWAGRTQSDNGKFGLEGGTNSGGGSVNNPLGTPPSSGGLPTGMLISGVYGDLGGEFLGATLRALESNNKVNSLAEPKILTLNNATGVLALENDVSYVESYQTDSQATSNVDGNSTVISNTSVVLRPQLEIEKEEISLKIIPSVARNSDIITLKVLPRVRQLREINQVPFQYQPSPNSDLITVQVERPEFDDRRLETVLHVQNGQTVALGGLVSARDQKSTTGLPWISRVPLLGRLFRTDSNSTDRRNLVIFVTAYLIDPSGAKVSDDIRVLRDSARVALPPAVREEILRRSQEEANQRAEDTGGTPAWQRGRR